MRNKIKIRNILTAVLIYTCFSPVVSSINRVDLPQSVLDENGGMYMSDNNSNSDSLSKATGLATHELSSSTEQWLNNFGTARIQLNIDDHGKWDHSSFDFLYPLFDNDKEILFAQMGFRAPDDRQTINLGMGVRTFTKNNWLIGGNIFFDNDTKGDNRRVGVGAEAWTDNFKLSANTYLGTTDWHSSRDFNNYNEKVANGFDVRAEGNLPLNPKIGIKLIYEKYQGDNVALFSKSELEKNPYSFTTGINYTPIPLITTGVDYRVGGAGQDDMRFYVNFIYSLGQTWEALTSSSEVLNLRKISGSRYDLVERNNEIILEYKEKERNNIVDNISLTLMKNNSPADGKSRNVILLHAASLDGRPVKNTTVSWLVSGDAKLDVVSSITDNNGNATIYVTNTKAEEITVTAMAGKTLEKIQTTFVTSASNLKLSVLKNNSIANGKETNEAKVIVYDIDGNMLPDITISWSLSNDASIVSSSKVTDNNGQALIKFSNTKPGQVTLTATAGDIESQATTAFIAVPVTKVAVTMTTNNSPADGTTQNVAQAVVTGADGKPLKGVNVTWSIGGSATGT
ncbi:inverse autotransporter beta domain-containing protein, partial [Enterobacter ludwigii]|uniref:inverse autotransporter beta domain-containing protein n=1 Tax=Enterobacter ludwigii TaxID=299767 RepID=UPI0034270AC3